MKQGDHFRYGPKRGEYQELLAVMVSWFQIDGFSEEAALHKSMLIVDEGFSENPALEPVREVLSIARADRSYGTSWISNP